MAFTIGSPHWDGLAKMIEEGGELIDVLPELVVMKSLGKLTQVGNKIIGADGAVYHWDGSNLNRRLMEEMADTLAAIEYFIESNPHHVDLKFIERRKKNKLKKFRNWRAKPPKPPVGPKKRASAEKKAIKTVKKMTRK